MGGVPRVSRSRGLVGFKEGFGILASRALTVVRCMHLHLKEPGTVLQSGGQIEGGQSRRIGSPRETVAGFAFRSSLQGGCMANLIIRTLSLHLGSLAGWSVCCNQRAQVDKKTDSRWETAPFRSTKSPKAPPISVASQRLGPWTAGE